MKTVTKVHKMLSRYENITTIQRMWLKYEKCDQGMKNETRV